MHATVACAAAPAAPRARARGAARANLAGALGQVWANFGAPGSILLMLFLKEGLNFPKWQLGLVMTLTYLGPTFEPAGACLLRRLGRRRRLFLAMFLASRLPYFALAALPWIGGQSSGQLGVAVAFAVIAFTRVANHLGAPAWWSWIADLVPERRRARFFACRSQWCSAASAAALLLGMALLESCGGMANSWLVSVLFSAGALFGTLDILLYLRVPEPPRQTETRLPAGKSGELLAPYREPRFRRLLLGMGLWSFSANLVVPLLPVYQRGEWAGHCRLGLGLSLFSVALLSVLGSLAAMACSRRWGEWGSRLGPHRLLAFGAGYLFVNLAYLAIGPGRGLWFLVPLAMLSGALSAGWTVGSQQLLLSVAPAAGRSWFVSVYNCTNGWLMAGGPLLAGWLADRWPVLGWRLPGGLPCCYFHLLLGLAALGGLAALTVLLRVPATAAHAEREWTPTVGTASNKGEPETMHPGRRTPCLIRS